MGSKTNDKQNFLCRSCGKQFQNSYQYAGADPANKKLIYIMLLRNCGVRDIETILGVNCYNVLRSLKNSAQRLNNIAHSNHYLSIQINELWTYVGRQKDGKVWLLYAYSPKYNEIVVYVKGDRSAKTVDKLYQKLKQIEVEELCTNERPAFQKMLPIAKHKEGKEYTKHIEGVNTC
ncbi:insertion element IS1 protein InsB [Catalinimonas alkaloidigena]|uniref:IS1 family transposase n=1 Tax=Catalinimonas alkaloidigena TaxID=1075417 RepID=UPI002405DE37|nr:IS1 family transposase [Catalinimonas alkaloidigena]MDF9798355.1 insertion element IS1 protein InsB [Catalinimonas alkaloidigena]